MRPRPLQAALPLAAALALVACSSSSTEQTQADATASARCDNGVHWFALSNSIKDLAVKAPSQLSQISPRVRLPGWASGCLSPRMGSRHPHL